MQDACLKQNAGQAIATAPCIIAAASEAPWALRPEEAHAQGWPERGCKRHVE